LYITVGMALAQLLGAGAPAPQLDAEGEDDFIAQSNAEAAKLINEYADELVEREQHGGGLQMMFVQCLTQPRATRHKQPH
jgi:hypothetical protein